MVYGRGLSPCIKHGTTNDGFIGRGAIDDKEIDLLGKLLRVHPNGYRQGDGSHGEDLGAIEPY